MTTCVKPNHERQKLKNLMNAVFRSVWFDDKNKKTLLLSSYFANFFPLVWYAENNTQNPTEYFLGIRDCLLDCKGVHDVVPNLNLQELVRFAESKKVNAAFYLNSLLNKKIKTEKDARQLVLTIKQNSLALRYGRQ